MVWPLRANPLRANPLRSNRAKATSVETIHRPARPLARLLRRGSGHRARGCARLRSLQAKENPKPFGTFVSGNHLKATQGPLRRPKLLGILTAWPAKRASLSYWRQMLSDRQQQLGDSALAGVKASGSPRLERSAQARRLLRTGPTRGLGNRASRLISEVASFMLVIVTRARNPSARRGLACHRGYHVQVTPCFRLAPRPCGRRGAGHGGWRTWIGADQRRSARASCLGHAGGACAAGRVSGTCTRRCAGRRRLDRRPQGRFGRSGHRGSRFSPTPSRRLGPGRGRPRRV